LNYTEIKFCVDQPSPITENRGLLPRDLSCAPARKLPALKELISHSLAKSEAPPWSVSYQGGKDAVVALATVNRSCTQRGKQLILLVKHYEQQGAE